MASRNATKALRASVKQLTSPRVQQRTFVGAVNAARSNVLSASKPAAAVFSQQQQRGLKTVDFAGSKEEVFGMDGIVESTQKLKTTDEMVQSVLTGHGKSFLYVNKIPSPSG